MHTQTRATLYGLAAVLLWSTVATAFKLSLRHLDYAQLLFYANLTSLLVLAAILSAQGKWPQVFAGSAADYRRSLLLGVLNPFLYYLVLFKAYDLLPAQIAQPINYTWALTLALLSIPLLKQRIGARDLIAGVICYAGVVVISTRGDVLGFRLADPLGVGLALGSTVIWALYWIYNTRDSRDPVVGLFLSFVFGLPFVTVYCATFSQIILPTGPALLGAVYVGTVEMGITFVLWLNALKLSSNTAKVGNLIFISPFLSLVFIHFLLGETILPATFVGLVLIVGGLVYQQLKPAGRQVE